MQQYKLPKGFDGYLEILNQVFEIEKKANKIQEQNSILRNVNRLKDIFENNLPFQDNSTGFYVENPIGEDYNETRIDLDANIAGEGGDNLVVVEVIKPIIRIKSDGITKLVQKGVVIVESKK